MLLIYYDKDYCEVTIWYSKEWLHLYLGGYKKQIQLNVNIVQLYIVPILLSNLDGSDGELDNKKKSVKLMQLSGGSPVLKLTPQIVQFTINLLAHERPEIILSFIIAFVYIVSKYTVC